MCDILHLRHYKLWFRSDIIFSLLGLKKQQDKLLAIIHGLTGSVSSTLTLELNKITLNSYDSPRFWMKNAPLSTKTWQKVSCRRHLCLKLSQMTTP